MKTRHLSATIAAISAILSLSNPAAAVHWTGCYVDVQGGAATADNKLDFSNNNGNGINNLTVDGFGAQGTTIGLGAGCDVQAKQFVFGLFGDWDWFNSMDTTISNSHLGTLASFSYDDQWALGGRAGLLVTDSTLLYGLVAYTRMNTSDLKVMSVSFPVGEFSGVALGGGLQTALTNNLLLGMEYRFNRYDSQTIDLGYGDEHLTLSPDVQTVRATITYKFDFFGPASPPPPLK